MRGALRGIHERSTASPVEQQEVAQLVPRGPFRVSKAHKVEKTAKQAYLRFRDQRTRGIYSVLDLQVRDHHPKYHCVPQAHYTASSTTKTKHTVRSKYN